MTVVDMDHLGCAVNWSPLKAGDPAQISDKHEVSLRPPEGADLFPLDLS